MSKKQTAVEWLCQQFEQTIGRSIMLVMESEIEQAKQMEKEQIIEAFWNGDNTDCTAEQNSKEFAEQYYNDNYDQ